MKILRKETKKVHFIAISSGIIFLYGDEVFMKVETNRRNKEYNAVQVNIGRLVTISGDDEIIPMLGSELVVK